MKKLLLSAAAMTLLFTACKKKDDNGTGNGMGKNQWKIGTTTYNAVSAASVQAAGSVLIASGMHGTSELSSFTASFSGTTMPATGGQFKIVQVADEANEVAITVGTNGLTGGNAKSWGAPSSTTATATVTVDGGKVSISVPEITVTSASADPSSITFSGNATQY